MMKPFFSCTFFLFLPSLFLSWLPQSTTSPSAPTPIPAEAARMVNPFPPNPESLARAKKIYGYDCAICHGVNGNGKGEAATDLKLVMKDYTDPAALKDLSDGTLFYIIRNGKGQMPPEEEARAKAQDVWNMVVLVRSFSQK